MAEEWRPVVGYEGLYEVSSRGRVRSLERTIIRGSFRHRQGGGIRRPGVTTAGYERINLYSGGSYTSWYVHVLVLTAFVGPRPDGMLGLHADGNSRNNNVANLRWGTHSDNALDALRHGTHAQRAKTHCPRNHPFDEANTYARPDGARGCRTCRKMQRRAAYLRERQR